jgi:hypothetical protein
MADSFRAPTPVAKRYYERYQAVTTAYVIRFVTYHTDELLQALAMYDDGRYYLCRQRCLRLLEIADLPRLTKCETLQLAASCSYHYEARRLLLEALEVCDEVSLVEFLIPYYSL